MGLAKAKFWLSGDKHPIVHSNILVLMMTRREDLLFLFKIMSLFLAKIPALSDLEKVICFSTCEIDGAGQKGNDGVLIVQSIIK